MYGHACRQYILPSHNICLQCYAFSWTSFHIAVQKKKTKGLSISYFALLLVVFNWHYGCEGVNLLSHDMHELVALFLYIYLHEIMHAVRLNPWMTHRNSSISRNLFMTPSPPPQHLLNGRTMYTILYLYSPSPFHCEGLEKNSLALSLILLQFGLEQMHIKFVAKRQLALKRRVEWGGGREEEEHR